MSVTEKAVKYLAEGRVKVTYLDSTKATLSVQGSETYAVGFRPSGWNCTCKAQTECCHIIAAKLITDLHLSNKVTLGCPDEILSKLIA